MSVQPIPPGFHSITPYLIIDGAAAAIEFYKSAFAATELFRMPGPDGRLGHAEIRIGNSPVMLADPCPEMGFNGPKGFGGTPVSLMIYTEDSDAMYGKAVELGAKVVKPLANQFYGDRSGTVEDPFGHIWTISTHIEDVPPEEMEQRAAAAMNPPANI